VTEDQVQAAIPCFVRAGDWQSVAVLMEPTVSATARINVQHIDAANHASGDANQLTGMQRP
jgi:hypothetical protein